ncbi:MAG: Holliday junction resolvase RuvX [Chthoniobacterales bacterium]
MNELQIKRRVLGIDFGQARIGVAVSDELQLLAHPVETIPAVPLKAAIARVAALAKDRNAERIVVGLPRHLNGSVGTSAREALAFAEQLRTIAPCEVAMHDERMSTLAANRALQEAGRKTRETRGYIDQVAAQVILQSYLDLATDALPSDLPIE